MLPFFSTNRVYNEWSATFANDSAKTAAVLDRVIHHCYTVLITGKSRRRDEAAKQEV